MVPGTGCLAPHAWYKLYLVPASSYRYLVLPKMQERFFYANATPFDKNTLCHVSITKETRKFNFTPNTDLSGRCHGETLCSPKHLVVQPEPGMRLVSKNKHVDRVYPIPKTPPPPAQSPPPPLQNLTTVFSPKPTTRKKPPKKPTKPPYNP